MSFDEIQVVIDVRELFSGNLVCHEVGEHLFSPHVIKPFHGYKVAKPHVSCLMGDKIQTGQFFIGSRILAEEDLMVSELNAPRMFHAPELIARQHHKSIFLKGVGDASVLFHPLQGKSHFVEYDRQLCYFSTVGFTIESCQFTPVSCRLLLLETPGCK